MTVAAAAAKAGPYTGNDSASAFAFAFKVFADADIRVVETLIATGASSDLVLNTDYIVTRNVDQDADPGGEITYKVGGVTTAYPSTKKLTIIGDFDYEQPTDIPNGGPFYAAVIEKALDRVTLLIKQLKEAVDRGLRIPVGEENATELPSVTERASKYLAFDVNGDMIAVAGTTSEIPITPFAETLLDDADAAAVRATLGLYNKFVQRVAATPITAVTSSNVQILADDSIPQSTEGVEVFTVAITPENATDILRIEADFSVMSCAGATTTVIALFKNNDVNAIAVAVVPTLSGATYTYQGRLVHDIVAGGTDEITFKVRFGPAGATTSYLNANGAGSRFFGGIASAKLQVCEYEP